MTAIELLFAVVLVGAVPLGLRLVELRDEPADRWIARVQPAVWPAAAALGVATLLAPGPAAALLAAPWLAISAAVGVAALVSLVRSSHRGGRVRRLAVAVSLGFLAFGAVNAGSFVLGFAPLGFAPVIVLLTAVHFHAAGFVGLPGAAVAGAVTVAIGGLLIGWATLRLAPTMRSSGAKWLSAIGGGAVFASMPLAIGWAVGTSLGAPPFGLDVMIRTHGAINAVAVCVPLMLAWTLEARATGAARARPRAASTSPAR